MNTRGDRKFNRKVPEGRNSTQIEFQKSKMFETQTRVRMPRGGRDSKRRSKPKGGLATRGGPDQRGGLDHGGGLDTGDLDSRRCPNKREVWAYRKCPDNKEVWERKSWAKRRAERAETGEGQHKSSNNSK